MFNLGAGEVMVLLLLALVVLGPQRLPEAARQIGKFTGELRRMSNGFQRELRSALDDPVEAAARERGAQVRAVTTPVPAVQDDAPGATATPDQASTADAAPKNETVRTTTPATKARAKQAAAKRAAPAKKSAGATPAAKAAGGRKRAAPLRSPQRPS